MRFYKKNTRMRRISPEFDDLLRNVKTATDIPIVRQTQRLAKFLSKEDIINIINNKKQLNKGKKEFDPFH